MKPSTLIAAIFLCNYFFTNPVEGQKFIDTYYTYNWRETPTKDDASFFSHALNTDSGWYRIDYLLTSGKSSYQMIGLYEDKENKIRNGTFGWYYPNGRIKELGKYKHGKKDGLWLHWYSNGLLKDSMNFLNGNYAGISMSWFPNGNSKDSLNLNEKGYGTYVAWFSDGTPSEAGRYKEFKKSGKWVFYHSNGKISSIETYLEDSLKAFQYYDENGLAQDDTTTHDSGAVFKGGKKGWNNYATSYLHYPSHIDLINGDHIVVVVETTIDEQGNAIDSEIAVPFYPAFDKEALRFVSQSPKWIPAIEHNRKVRDTFTISIQFGQSFE